jgi:hypothetical protein
LTDGRRRQQQPIERELERRVDGDAAVRFVRRAAEALTASRDAGQGVQRRAEARISAGGSEVTAR